MQRVYITPDLMMGQPWGEQSVLQSLQTLWGHSVLKQGE